MSDFLGNLVAKSLAPERLPAVQPRLASRFEPVGPEIREQPGSMEETAEETVAPQSPPTPRHSSSPSPPRREGQGGRMRRAERFEEEEVLETPGRVARRGGMPSEASPPDSLSGKERGKKTVEREVEVVRRGVARRDEAPFETSPPGPLSHRPSPGRERGNVEAAVVAEEGPIRPLATIPSPPRQDVPVTSPLSRPGEGRRERGTGGEVSRASLREPHQPAEQKTPLPILQPQVAAVDREPFPVRPEPPAPEPVIHVTIGRIEVRAAPAPKAPARERQAARPPVDLEEYLRQRSRGEGR